MTSSNLQPEHDRPLSLCFVAHSSGLAGAERTLLELVTALIRDHGCVCSVLLPGHGPLKARLLGVGATCLVAPYGWWSVSQSVTDEECRRQLAESFVHAVAPLLVDLERINPDIVVTHTIAIPWGAVIAFLLEKPHVWHLCEYGDSQFLFPFVEILDIVRRSSAFIFTITNEHRRILFPDLDETRCLPLYRHIEIPPTTDDEARCGTVDCRGHHR
jgi:hypothetical protein